MNDDVEVTVPGELVFAINRAVRLNEVARKRQARIAVGAVSYRAGSHRPGCTCGHCPKTVSEAQS